MDGIRKKELTINHRNNYSCELIHSGQVSNVYKAFDLNLERSVCIKEIECNCEEEYRKALNEVKALVKVSSTNNCVPEVYYTHYETNNSTLYIVMEWIHGKILSKELVKNEYQLRKYIIQLCNILITMKKYNMSHKDLKPQNIIITESDNLYLLDFNITISHANTQEGTKNYKAPEMSGMIRCGDRSKSDMFSIGVIMYELLCELPLEGKHYCNRRRIVSLQQKTWDIFKSPKELNPKISDKLNEIICKCMELYPENRFKNYYELITVLKQK